MRLSEEPLISRERLAERVRALGGELDAAYAGETLRLICVLKGSFLFTADLMRELSLEVRVDFIRAKSYAGTSSTGTITLTHLPEETFADEHVLVVEDILDTGHTARHILDHLKQEHPASLRLIALLDKPSRRVADVRADYVGFQIEDHFVVGYGLDLDERYRELPDIRTLVE